ncbi:MAG TPA: hypothetical protein VLE27_17370 [Thermoanaerobaculia bacterium]|nr:hypothetical protein [Thermoanaerobaculia bacterium]
MSAEHVALLAGLFAVPALLLALGHRLRRRPPFWRRVFWGAVAGHSLALLVTLAAALYPPIAWAEGPRPRDNAVHWTLLLGALAGGAIGGVALSSRGMRDRG